MQLLTITESERFCFLFFMEYGDYLGYSYPYQYPSGPSAVPYAIPPNQRPPVPLVDLTASTVTFGPCISSNCGSSGRSSAGVGIAVNITSPGSAEVSQPWAGN